MTGKPELIRINITEEAWRVLNKLAHENDSTFSENIVNMNRLIKDSIPSLEKLIKRRFEYPGEKSCDS